MPNFEYKSLKNKILSSENLSNKKTLFVYFSTECGSCSKALKEINNSSELKSSLNIILITDEKNKSKIDDFLKINDLVKLKELVYLDKEDNFIKDFGLGLGIVISYPQLILFDEKRKFIKVINEISEIKQNYIKN